MIKVSKSEESLALLASVGTDQEATADTLIPLDLILGDDAPKDHIVNMRLPGTWKIKNVVQENKDKMINQTPKYVID